MNKTEYLLVCLMEECAEVQQAASKALRFGLNDEYKELATPKQYIVQECCDLLAVIELLEEENIIPKSDHSQAIEQKKTKVGRYMEYAKERNTLI